MKNYFLPVSTEQRFKQFLHWLQRFVFHTEAVFSNEAY